MINSKLFYTITICNPPKSEYGDMEASDLSQLKALEEENRKLKKLFANVSVQNMALKDVIEKKHLLIDDSQ